MDPATTALLIKTAGELIAMAIGMIRKGGDEQTATQLEAILAHSDLLARGIVTTANSQLDQA